jgi:hypothetical protein
MVSYKIEYNLEQDAYNWWDSVNHWHSEGRLKTEEEREIARKINGLSFEQALEILRPYLENRKNKSTGIFIETMQEQFAEYFEAAVRKMEEVTGFSLAVEGCANNRAKEIAKIHPERTAPNENLYFPITTFPAMVVYYEEGVIFTYAKIDNELWGMPLDGTLHELLHFQTDAYWRQPQTMGTPEHLAAAKAVAALDEDQYFKLKESLTVILDESWKPIITLPDCSYPEFGEIRQKLHEYYLKNRDFDALMLYGASLV